MEPPGADASRHRARWCAFHAVSWIAPAARTTTPTVNGTARASAGSRVLAAVSATSSEITATPTAAQTLKYPTPTSTVCQSGRGTPILSTASW